MEAEGNSRRDGTGNPLSSNTCTCCNHANVLLYPPLCASIWHFLAHHRVQESVSLRPEATFPLASGRPRPQWVGKGESSTETRTEDWRRAEFIKARTCIATIAWLLLA